MIHRYSGIDTAHRCMYKFKLDYIDKLPQEGGHSIDLAFGTGLHSGLQAIMEGEDPALTFSIYWESVKGALQDVRNSYEELGALGQTFLARFLRLHAKKFTPTRIEQRLQGKIGGYDFEGTPDLVGLYEGVPSLIDFKTSAREYPKEKIVVNEQMPIYAELERQQPGGLKVEQLVYYVFIKGEGRIQTIKRPLTDALLTGALQNVILMCRELQGRTEYPKNPGSCVMGSWKCPRYQFCHGDK